MHSCCQPHDKRADRLPRLAWPVGYRRQLAGNADRPVSRVERVHDRGVTHGAHRKPRLHELRWLPGGGSGSLVFLRPGAYTIAHRCWAVPLVDSRRGLELWVQHGAARSRTVRCAAGYPAGRYPVARARSQADVIAPGCGGRFARQATGSPQTEFYCEASAVRLPTRLRSCRSSRLRRGQRHSIVQCGAPIVSPMAIANTEGFLSMQNTSSIRSWLGPLTGVAFAAIGLTGLLMLFHVRLSGMTLLHELAGLLFVVLAITHIALNAKALFTFCAKPRGLCAIGLGIVACALVLALGFGHEEHDDRGQDRIRPSDARASGELPGTLPDQHRHDEHGRRGRFAWRH